MCLKGPIAIPSWLPSTRPKPRYWKPDYWNPQVTRSSIQYISFFMHKRMKRSAGPWQGWTDRRGLEGSRERGHKAMNEPGRCVHVCKYIPQYQTSAPELCIYISIHTSTHSLWSWQTECTIFVLYIQSLAECTLCGKAADSNPLGK